MPKYRFSILSLLLLATTAFAQQPPAPVVQIAYVAETEVAPTVAVPGTIYSRNDVQLTAGVAGQLTMVVEPGTVVRAGQAVASIDKEPLMLQRAEQEVLLERAEINIRQLNSQLRRQLELSGGNLVSEFDLEQTEANRDLAVADAKLIKVRIRQIDDQIQRADVRAPFSGVVTTRLRRVGEDEDPLEDDRPSPERPAPLRCDPESRPLPCAICCVPFINHARTAIMRLAETRDTAHDLFESHDHDQEHTDEAAAPRGGGAGGAGRGGRGGRGGSGGGATGGAGGSGGRGGA